MMRNNWNSLFDVTRTFNEIDNLFRGCDGPLAMRQVPQGVFPAINLYEQDSDLVVTAEVPGVAPDSLELTVHGDTVELKGTRSHGDREQGRYSRRERRTGEFSRLVALPDNIDPDSVKAEYRDGILYISLNKLDAAKPRKVDIQS